MSCSDYGEEQNFESNTVEDNELSEKVIMMIFQTQTVLKQQKKHKWRNSVLIKINWHAIFCSLN